MSWLLASDDPLDHVLPHTLTEIGGVALTNHLLMLLVSAALLVLIIPLAARAGSIVPRGFRNLIEAVLQYVREQVARPVLGEHTDEYVPFLWTTFFLILTANLLGMLPIGAAGGLVHPHLAHIGGTATGNFMVTSGLALCAFFFIHVSGIRKQGFVHYMKSLAPHVPWPVLLLLYPLEIVGAFVKAFALAIRLFANMIAGHIVLAVLVGFAVAGLHMGGGGYAVTGVSILGGAVMSILEVFVAFLQAYIFTFLTTLFVGMAIHPEH